MKLLSLFLIVLFYAPIYGQNESMSEDEMAVKAVVLEVFDAMRATDSIRLKKCFYDQVDVYTSSVNRTTGKSNLTKDNIQQFYTSVGTPHDGLYDEKLGEFEIKVDDHLASIWVDYYFFVDEKFSHCGVDFFQLYKTNDGWKIFFLSDTRRRKSCEVPDKSKLW